MAEVNAALVKELRDKTGAGMMDCKRALAESKGNLETALEALRKRGISIADKKAGRTTSEGLVEAYIHAGGKIGVLVEINCETDFVARTDEFSALVKHVAMHIAAANPRYLKSEEISAEVIEKEKEITREQAKNSGKPEKSIESIVTGKLKKFYSENCLLEQPFIRDPEKTINDLVKEYVAKLGENITIRRFSRFQLGSEA